MDSRIDDRRERLIRAVENLDEIMVINSVKAYLTYGMRKSTIFSYLQEGMKRVDERYAAGEYYMADLIMSGTIFKDVMSLPEMRDSGTSAVLGTVVIGTVAEDVHDLGKNMVAGILSASGFEVHDLGISVTSERFVGAVAEYHPDILAMSGVISSASASIKKTVDLLTASSLRDKVKIFVGGPALTQEMCDEIGVDYYSSDSVSALNVCLRWVRK